MNYSRRLKGQVYIGSRIVSVREVRVYPYFISTNWQLLRREDPTPACGVLLIKQKDARSRFYALLGRV